MKPTDLRSVSTHFAFGKNWADFAVAIDDDRIADAEEGLRKLVPPSEIAGRSFLDIGCGSGLHALAALRLGAGRVLATDIDANSVATTRHVLGARAEQSSWQAEELSAFDLDPTRQGTFDIVYSWGVLHHTGDMREAIGRAARMVAAGGLLVLALYRKTLLCPLWKREKRFYSQASPNVQAGIRATFLSIRRTVRRARGKNTVLERRGMDLSHDAHDWLGGYPYESITPQKMDECLRPLGFSAERVFARTQPQLGLLGSGCDEFVYRKTPRGDE